MSDYKTLVVRREADGTAFVEMARASVHNAFDEQMIAELGLAFAALGERDEVRIIVLGAHGSSFSAGADLSWMQRASQADHDWHVEDARRFAAMLDVVAACPKPTIARVQGLAQGGGVGLVCACDIAVASDAARFEVSEARLGILPAVIGPYLVNAVGKRQARRLALTAAQIGADEALAIGLVQQVVPAEGLDEAVSALRTALGQGGPKALAEIKSLYAQLNEGPITSSARELTAQTIARVRSTEEAREGFAAFLEKRPTRWVRA